MSSNWVEQYAGCTIAAIYQDIIEQVRRDVAAANRVAGAAPWSVKAIHGGYGVEWRGHESAIFIDDDTHIVGQRLDDNEAGHYTLRPQWSEEARKCILIVTTPEQELVAASVEEFSRMVLFPLFFPTPR